jgi:hypothetical protein
MAMRTMITMPLETLALIIDKARELQLPEDFNADTAEDEGEDEEGEPDFELVDEEADDLLEEDEDGEEVDEEDEIDDDELEEILSELSDHELAELAALAWIGSGEFDKANWHDALSTARAKTEDDLIDELLVTAALGDLIARGLVSLGYREIADGRSGNSRE